MIQGSGSLVGLGGSVAGAGDVDADGYDDLIVGTGDSDQAFAHLGSASGLTTLAAWTAVGDQDGSYFGGCVATAGDVNGDGYDDVIVSSSYDNGIPAMAVLTSTWVLRVGSSRRSHDRGTNAERFAGQSVAGGW
jgi:hypothetical protein